MQGDAEMTALQQAMLQMQQERQQAMLQMQQEWQQMRQQHQHELQLLRQDAQLVLQDLQLVETCLGPDFIRGASPELLLFDAGKQLPTAPLGNTSCIQTEARLQTKLQTTPTW